jgi:hypothetical protein
MRGMGQAVPTCLDEGQSLFLASCIGQLPPPGMSVQEHRSACDDYMWLEGLPYCPSTPRAPIPTCLGQEEVDLVDYCHHGDGSSPFWNAFCWGGQKDPAWWSQYTSTPPCQGVVAPAPPNGAPGPNGNGVRTAPQQSNMLLYGGLAVGAVVIIGGAVWLARKK